MDTQARTSILNWREAVCQEALTWTGTPFHHKGRIKGVGADCGGFLYEVFRKAVPTIPFQPFLANYPEDWALHQENQIYLQFLKPYFNRIEEKLIGCIVVYEYGRNFSHGTIYLGKGKYIHCWGRTGAGTIRTTYRQFFSDNTGKLRRFQIHDVMGKWLKPRQ